LSEVTNGNVEIRDGILEVGTDDERESEDGVENSRRLVTHFGVVVHTVVAVDNGDSVRSGVTDSARTEISDGFNLDGSEGA
jgi:hypothetical protein